MNRRKSTTAALTAMLILAVTAGAGPVLPSAVAADDDPGPLPVVLPAAARAVPRATQILDAGTTGFLFVEEDDNRLLWTDYRTGTTSALPETVPAPDYDIDGGWLRWSESLDPGYFGAGSDTVAVYEETPAPHVTLRQRAGGDVTELALPQGQEYVGTFGGTVLTRTGSPESPTGFHLLTADDGAVTDRPVTGLPDGVVATSVEDGDATSVVLGYGTGSGDNSRHWGILDVAGGALTPLPDRPSPDAAWEVSGFRLAPGAVLRLRMGRGMVDVLDRKDLAAAPRTVDTSAYDYQAAYGLVGDSLLAVEPVWPGNNLYRGQPLGRLPLDGSARQTLMDPAAHQIVQVPDGSVLVAGAERYVDRGDLDWGIHRFTAAADGTVKRTRVTAVAPVPAQVYGLSLGGGVLTTADNSTLYEPGTVIGAYRSTWLSASGSPVPLRSTVDGLVSGHDGDWGCSTYTPRCIEMYASGDGFHGRRFATESGLTMVRGNGLADWGPQIDTGDDNPELADYSGRYVLVDGALSGKQYVGEVDENGSGGKILFKRDRVASALWGSTLWSAGTSGSEVTATSLPSGSPLPVFVTRNGCVPTELQAVGRWVYWNCADSRGGSRGAGVYDCWTRGTSTMPGDEALLGDGYLVLRAAGTGLTLYDLHDGLPFGGQYSQLPSRVLATSDELGAQQGRRTSWTVDRFGGDVAYADDHQRVHIVPTGVPTSRLAVIDQSPGASSLDLRKGSNWVATSWFSRPVRSQLTIKNKATGVVVWSRQPAAIMGHAVVSAAWPGGRDMNGRLVPNGTYAWTLTAWGENGVDSQVQSGTIKVTGGAAVRRDFTGVGGPDGFGDLLTQSSSGTLAFQQGGAGKFSGSLAGAGWATSVTAVPFGDLSGDRCNDVLVRLSNGSLRGYKPACGRALTTSTPYTSLGTGFQQYNVLTSPGDISGDGRPDLITRQSSTGDIYLYKATGTGTFAARVKIASRWTVFKKIVGAGDLDGDGFGDLLAQDTSNELWRFSGDGKGHFKPRVLLAKNWGASYNAVVGVGDITGDGKADLVVRDTAGVLYRYGGNGKGLFGGRVKIATGWKGYKAIA
ncbi:FG-GAP repeat domain-containing protein [Streptomyces sp. NPDC002574]|uniref:FG-GAP repeat domain-containing protein n=1 Tax=Streptomyces sp. NPDC002574 TaxID=3364652 RepID=UPI0036CB0DD9